MVAIPEAAISPIVAQLDRLSAAKLIRRKLDEERNLRDAAIRVKTEEAEREKQDKERREKAVAMAMAGLLTPEQALQTGIPEAVQASLKVGAQKEVGALPDIASVRKFEPTNPYQAEARKGRLAELVDLGELEREEEGRKKREDVSKSITAASSLEELDRIDTGGDSPLNTSLNRKRKALLEEQDRKLGTALAGYKGDIDGLEKFFEEKGFKPTPGELASAQDRVFKRKSFERVEKDMADADEARKAGKVRDAVSRYSSAQNALNAQIDDIEKKAIVESRDLVTGAVNRTMDLSRLSADEQTTLTRLKSARLKAVDALSGLAADGGTMSDEDLAAELRRLTEEAVRRKSGGK